ncbi:hypothetical protein EJ05DRAFT_130049 [Pseudovirgaria hyperparasitica]|uniref:Uncharacterized protein n=1 Tax=Pseudovirgaria hyperparasitica TaxID=470096 RepID=A0A6A6VWT9_9PEZI|nr:uncharacterized protein EJ05DRAFT_130049 [Pseudovirgaria hyperparasitica]KAF2754683.1 hypothetical protein EJ05DRAFT_130049 [Pseudovirgaria hyperparasitica]
MTSPSRDDDGKDYPASYSSSPDEHQTQNQNPFIAFRRFADQQINSIFGLLRDLSNDIASRHMPHPRRTPRPSENDALTPLQKEMFRLMEEAADIEASFRNEQNQSLSDPGLNGLTRYLDKTHGELLKPDWLLHSDYSPVQLEKDIPGIQWRAAFEDLVWHTMTTSRVSPEDLLDHRWENPEQWSKGLRERVGLFAVMKHADNLVTRTFDRHWGSQTALWPMTQPWQEEEDEEEEEESRHENDDEGDGDDDYDNDIEDEFPSTEQELYEKHFGITCKASNSSSDTLEHPNNSHKIASNALQIPTPSSHKPSVLSSMTTTERTVLPDGTITTKVVLKKHFANGKEETSETVHTTHTGLQTDECMHDTSAQGESMSDRVIRAEERKEDGKGGWFWR